MTLHTFAMPPTVVLVLGLGVSVAFGVGLALWLDLRGERARSQGLERALWACVIAMADPERGGGIPPDALPVFANAMNVLDPNGELPGRSAPPSPDDNRST